MEYGIYEIRYKLSVMELNHVYDLFSDDDLDIVITMQSEAFFDYEVDDLYTTFVVVEHESLDKFSNIMRKNEVELEVIDWSSKVLDGSFDLEGFLFSLISHENSYMYDFFIDEVNDWIMENLTIDIVLDNINLYGIDDLRYIEREFLNEYKP